MWFRNLQVYHLDEAWKDTPGALEEKLVAHRLQPCPPLATTSYGFVPPGKTTALVENVDQHLLAAVGIEQKVLPASVVADKAAGYAQDWESSRGLKPGRKLKREFKDRATTELLPRAFSRRRVVHLWIDAKHQRVIVDSPSPAPAETATETLRDALVELPLSLPTPERAAHATLSGWLHTGRAPQGFVIGEECELIAANETRATLRYQRHPLQTAEIRQHLDDAFHVSKLGLVWRDQLSFVIDEKLQIKRLQFQGMDEAEDAPELSDEERFAAEFALMTGTCSRMLDELFTALTITPAQ